MGRLSAFGLTSSGWYTTNGALAPLAIVASTRPKTDARRLPKRDLDRALGASSGEAAEIVERVLVGIHI